MNNNNQSITVMAYLGLARNQELLSWLITTRQRSCEKEVFSQVCVCLSKGGGPMWPLPMKHWTSLYRDPSASPPHIRTGIPTHWTSGLGNWYWSTYGFQAGGAHPIGMLSLICLQSAIRFPFHCSINWKHNHRLSRVNKRDGHDQAWVWSQKGAWSTSYTQGLPQQLRR